MAAMTCARASSVVSSAAARAIALVAFLVLSSAGVAWAGPTPEACVASYEQGQKLRAQGSLGAARKEFVVCAEATCPEVTKNDCATWIGQVEASLPTLTFAVTDEAGADVSEARVYVDGVLLVERLDGKAVGVDPGAHKLRFERDGSPPVELSIVVQEGEKNRRVELRLGQGGRSGTAAVSPAAWALGGVGLVGLVVFASLGGIGLAERSDAADTCGSACSDEVIDSIRTKFIAADVALGVGLASLAAGVAIGIATGVSEDGAATRATVRLAPPPYLDGVTVTVGAAF